MNELDDFLIGPQCDEYGNDWYTYSDEELHIDEVPQKRKNDWHHAKRNYRLLRAKYGETFLQHFKPIHYYSKTKPEFYYQRSNKTNNKGKHRNAYGNYNPSKNWSVNDKRKIDSGENQIDELFDTN